MKGLLNLFQVAMLRWRALHPYNAVHVAFVAAPLDRAGVVGAIDAQRRAFGVTGLAIDSANGCYEYRGGDAPSTVDFLATGTAAGHTALAAEIERQLNQPFPLDGAIDPMRFFVIAQHDGFHLGLAYDHFIAGGDAIAAFLQQIVLRYSGEPRLRAAPNLYPPTFKRLLARRARPFVRGMGALPALIASCRRGVRPRYSDDADGYNGFVDVELAPAATAALLDAARRWGVTFNDVVTAGTMLMLAPTAPGRLRSKRRRELGVASIVNLRGEFGPAGRDAFGQFLTSMRVAHPVPEGIALRALAQDVHRQTQRIKEQRHYLQTLLAIGYNGIVWFFLDARRRQRFYSKTYPVVAGVTTLNVDALWTADGGDRPRGYVRAVPTGPLAPLVVAATTAGGVVRLGVSYRRAAFARENVAKMAASLADLMGSVE